MTIQKKQQADSISFWKSSVAVEKACHVIRSVNCSPGYWDYIAGFAHVWLNPLGQTRALTPGWT